MGRSNLRDKEAEGGYNIVQITKDTFYFTERHPLSGKEKVWIKVPFQKHDYKETKSFPRPDFSINQLYPQVQPLWTFQSDANVISTPAVAGNYVVFGNQNGMVQALHQKNGKIAWQFKTDEPIFSSPAVAGDKIVFASTDGFVYCLNIRGEKLWAMKTGASVLGSPLTDSAVIYIGGSDHCYQALELQTGKPVWQYCTLNGPVVSRPVVNDSVLLFGAWDTYLYALNKANGKLLWKWSNGSPVINYAPAACIPVVQDGVVYIAAPDRYLTAIDVQTGKTIWRTNEATIRESIGLSEDGKLVYGKTMNDTIVAFYTNREKPAPAWRINAGFGYEHVPSKLIEKEGAVFFGIRNGVVYSIDSKGQKVNWAYKIDNFMVNTVKVLSGRSVIAATMDGKVCLLQEKDLPAKTVH
ncbi:MAG: PQQ-binding-like beta-propeller repeat protein [Flavisolibacter sp.]|nr:PQQ-binding-like beta-propeller repeat protein [Flavisolibacter sp.]